MKHETYLTNSSHQTKRLAEGLAKNILKFELGKKAIILALEGDLGGGKTTFIQGFARGLEINEKILSPTFVILKKFQIPWTRSGLPGGLRPKSQTNSKSQLPKFKIFYHIDCYRVDEPKELIDLGYKEIISNPQNIVAIEWADRVKKIIPKTAIFIKFDFINNKTRKITI